jgi:hypothetical protein
MLATMRQSAPELEAIDLPALSFVRLRLTMRLLSAARLPAQKAGMLRGGFGYAFQQASCPRSCWNAPACKVSATICPYRQIFATPRPPAADYLHDLRDVPRPFVIEPPNDRRTQYAAGEALEFTLVLLGRGIEYLPYFLIGFERFGQTGLGAGQAPARLERVEALEPWRPTGRVIYQDGVVLAAAAELPRIDPAGIAARAAALPERLRLRLHTPLRLKHRGAFIEHIDPTAIMQATCWRLDTLAAFHGGGRWPQNYRPLVEATADLQVREEAVQWSEWRRTSTRGGERRSMPLGGLLGSAVLEPLPPALRAVLLMGSLAHIGKACVFGHGGYGIAGA